MIFFMMINGLLYANENWDIWWGNQMITLEKASMMTACTNSVYHGVFLLKGSYSVNLFGFSIGITG